MDKVHGRAEHDIGCTGKNTHDESHDDESGLLADSRDLGKKDSETLFYRLGITFHNQNVPAGFRSGPAEISQPLYHTPSGLLLARTPQTGEEKKTSEKAPL
jgi:hypothetical protein